jgi:hypothetical protein
MKESTGNPPDILFCASTRRIPAELGHLTQADLRKQARYWVDGANKMPRDALMVELSKAMDDSAVAARVLQALAPQELAVAAVYRHYGGTVDGEVIRLDLMARGLLQIKENRISDYYTKREWKHNPISSLANRWILLSERRGIGYYSTVRDGPDKSFERYSLHAGIVPHVEPAVLPPGRLPPPRVIPRRSLGARRLRWPLICLGSSTIWRGEVQSRSDRMALWLLPPFEPWKRWCH